jgi:hypothetical protein
MFVFSLRSNISVFSCRTLEMIRNYMNIEDNENNETTLNGGQLCDAIGFSRWSLHRCKRRGYKMEFGNRTSLGHFKKWLRANPIPDGRSGNRVENPRVQAAMLEMGLAA